ncbi:hypothetical protein GSI_08721 [Ganoderma sinense ZZ0214-1]|uniref:Uncharacterized protein n=1 Tax=Ganoderma sinense ZZ0214-1 TaxID=1077348 RepID=A0A2G8S4L8_9APHY|nr:hypothetical protein GSI_08721 [Ganoderma sinense ZZ0214-1]
MFKAHQNEPVPHPGHANAEILWEAAYNGIWKEGRPFVRNEGGVDVLVDLLGAMARQSPVMVRSEYLQVFQHIRTMMSALSPAELAGLVLTGHSGIGKTSFLYYALGAALAAHMPVVFCNRSDFCVLFDYHGVHVINLAGAFFGRRILFLVDSNSNICSPPGAFTQHTFGGMIVQATSPDPSRWKQWAKELCASSWVMGLWEREEMLALQRTTEALGQPAWASPPPGTAVYTPVEVFDLLGPSPRTCMREAGRVKSQDGPQADFAAYLALPALSSDFEGVLSTVCCDRAPPKAYEADDLERIFFLSNAGRPNPYSRSGMLFHYNVPTLFLCRTLCAALRARPTATQRHIARTFAPSSAGAAPFYLPLALDLLLGSRAGHTCHIVDPESQTESSSTPASFRLGPGLSLRAAPFPLPSPSNSDLDAPTPYPDLDLHAIPNNTVLFVPPLPISATDAPPRAFHALVVSKDKDEGEDETVTRATLLRMPALADTPHTFVRLWPIWPRPDAEVARDCEAIRAIIRSLEKEQGKGGREGERKVRWTLVYVAVRPGAAERAARAADARAIVADPELRGRVALGWVELRGDIDDGHEDARRLLEAFEAGKDELREDCERWNAQYGLGAAEGARNATAGSSGGSPPTQKRGVFARAVARIKARQRNFLPCLNI